MKDKDKISNAKLKYAFKQKLRHALQRALKTVEKMLGIINLYEKFFNGDLLKFGNKESFISYKDHLKNDRGLKESAYLNHCNTIREFYKMVLDMPKISRKVIRGDLDYLNISQNERNALYSSKILKAIPSIDTWIKMVDSIIIKTAKDLKERALIVFLLFAPTRVGTITSLQLQHFNKKDLIAIINPIEGVDAKFRQGNWGKLLVFEPDYLKCLTEYLDYLASQGFSDDDALFSSTLPYKVDENGREQFNNLRRSGYKSTNSINEILKKRSAAAGEKYYSPHRYRDLHVMLARRCCVTREQYNAVTENLGHKGDRTADRYYGNLTKFERFEVLDQIDFSRHREPQPNLKDLLEKLERNSKQNESTNNKLDSILELFNQKSKKVKQNA
ncbi:site-specific integrase [candidate division KSB1 bacterium]|nr:site-specific integrase [candidate division KSB1 bacterium]